MELQITGPFNKLSTEDLEILDDVVQSFCEAVEVVLKTNFKSQNRGANISEGARNLVTGPEGATKNQRIAAVFCRQWIAGVVSELTHKLANDTSERLNYGSGNLATASILEEADDEDPNGDDIAICVENARICGNGQIEVNYDFDPGDVAPHLKPKLKAQELTQLILQGKQTEYELIQKLERFWSDLPSMLCQYLAMEDDIVEEPGDVKQDCSQDVTSGGRCAVVTGSSTIDDTHLPIDDESIELLEAIARGDTNTEKSDDDMDDSVQQKLVHLEQKAKELGIQGMDRYIALYNKVNKEITKVNKMAKFFSKFATDLTASRINT
ncbi:Fnr-like transcriptional activator, putative [Babesia ovis]|uniref:Fnr-like transcriptional activator, putative n=1 Tax=Babesia ovis TaxID=5869 RepID=A0A9W5TBR1_BABOV|nr:Fnr-like transcriptional activator, putative [Babesia ovis]